MDALTSQVSVPRLTVCQPDNNQVSTPRRDPPGSCVTTNQNDNTTPTSPAESDHTDNRSWPKFMQRIGYPHIEPPPEGDDQNNQTTLEINGTLNLTMDSDTYNDPAAPDFSKWPFPAKELPHTLANIYDLLDCPSISSGPRRCRGLPSQQSSFYTTQPLLYCVHAVHIETSYRRTLQHLVASRYYAFRMGTLCQSIILFSSGRPFYVWWAFSRARSHFSLRRGGASYAYHSGGAAIQDIMSHGTWASDAVRAYLIPGKGQLTSAHKAIKTM